MYENQTENIILNRMLEKVPNDIDKREGSIIYDASIPAAIEFMLLYATVDYFIKNTFGDTAEREFLILRAKERGLAPYPATYAIVKGECTPNNINISVGTRFSYDDVNYSITESLGNGQYLLKCETIGIIGNKPSGKLVPIDYVKGLEFAQLLEVTIPGEEEETTEDFRTRYLNSFENQAYGGNIIDYKEKVNAIEGVGGVKVYPVWNGGGTVKIVFMTSEYKPPTAEFIKQVQTKIDPEQNKGEGLGIAPIGHIVTVEGAKNSAIKIDLNITFNNGSFIDYKTKIEKVIDDYFLELNSKWQDTQVVTMERYENKGIIVRISQIESRLLDLKGVTDVEHTKLNDLEENLTLDINALAVRGELSG
ncbi:baseplate J/gp47 family protein [Megamonas funiformis]|jgi:uncharacterized phage protein gp47/JayE|uniref:baseplate J/gp47 family protein n=1 Tax=Megamonas funiformis TaxID=437897 RepID=UPI0026654E12|nr:baseplate J/gp47 family protein [Megamonas funiformis]